MNFNLCNNCGGEYEYRGGRWVCRACGAYKPEEHSSEENTLLYTAFQKLRLAEFSDAEQEFEDIVMKYPENPNGYWGRLMSRYGIKYEEDFDGRMIPTCYATSIHSVVDDGDYRLALKYADGDTKNYYQEQATYIESVRLTWLEKAKREKPYDIFICYKDSDLAKGISRTQDSFVAQEIYTHLLEQGYRVFFSRESLRDKTGEKYEPYIFNALSTAKIMLVYGTSAAYINSTWLKNEWHRFSKRIAAGEKHPEALLVACDGFSPSELPSALALRQCFDANRKTFFGDLDHCIERIMGECRQTEILPKKEEVLLSGLHEHSYKTKIVKPTCVAKGYTLHRCDCGYEYRDSYTPLTDHKFKIVSRTEPTCKNQGAEEKVCEVCGERKSTVIPTLGHQFTKWVETTHPTCTEDGEEQRKCLRCGEIEKKIFPKTGHSFGDWVANGDGTYASYCKNCGATQVRETRLETTAFMAKDVPPGAVYPIKQVFKNGFDYYKSYFTSHTTKSQKLQKTFGILFQLFWIVMAVSSLLGQMNATVGEVFSGVGALILLAMIPFGIHVLVFTKAENNRLKKEFGTFEKPRRVRLSFWIMSRCMLWLVLGMIQDMGNDIASLYIALFFFLWGMLSLFFAFAPKAYKKIGITKHFSVDKILFVCLTIAISLFLIALSP